LNRLDEFKLLVVEHYQKKTDCKCNKWVWYEKNIYG
jgi:hypothetical protein